MNENAPIAPNNLEAFWMPFTANRQFKQTPRMFVAAKDMHYTTSDGRQVLDGTAGLWCVNAGHCRPRIVEAIQKQAAELDYAPAFQMGHPKAFELASRLAAIAPSGLDHVFFTNSGSESVETALKIALAYHRAKGDGARFRLIGRERGYHGVNFGGISVGGIVGNRKMFGTLLTGVDHMRHTHDPVRNGYSSGETEHGAELADDLLRIAALHDPSTIAAVIVEPVAGSTGVLPPPKGYLKRLREICDQHGILLIFDEVITGYGRMGTAFAADYFGVTPDIMRCRASDRIRPRLYLFRQSHRRGGGPGDAGDLQGRRAVRTGEGAGAGLGRGDSFAEGRAPRHRHPHHRPDRRHRAGADCRRADQAGLLGLPGSLRKGAADPHHRRYHRPVAAADDLRGPDRRDRRNAARHPEDPRLTAPQQIERVTP